MQFRVRIDGESNLPEVDLTTPLAVDDIFELGDGSKVRALAILYDPVGSPPTPDMLIIAARVA